MLLVMKQKKWVLVRTQKKMNSMEKKGVFEKWLDNHNHKMELMRTVFGFMAAITGVLVFLKVFGLI